jgi:hypothetical protein
LFFASRHPWSVIVLTKADDYPIHQTPDPIALSDNRNCYDRYFFNGHALEGGLFFGAAFGVYPHLNVMDGAFSVVVDGIQHNLRVSRRMGWERMDTQVGPLSIEVIEPLQCLRVRVRENAHGIEAALTFRGRRPPLEETRQRSRRAGRVSMDITRMTQNGNWDGWIAVNGRQFEVRPEQMVGVRDRSWGIRQVGVPRDVKEMVWLWAPLQAQDREILFYAIESPHGEALVQGAQVASLNDGTVEHMADAFADLQFRPGTREISEATLHLVRCRGRGEIQVVLKPRRQSRLFLNGLGYGHQEWGHGFDKGALAIGYDSFESDAITVHREPHLHPVWAQYEAAADAEVIFADGQRMSAHGCLEQILLGDYAPAGLKGLTAPQVDAP